MLRLRPRPRNAIAGVLALLLLLPAQAAAEAGPRGGKIRARVRGRDGKTPIAAAVVHAHHLETGKIYSSKPTTGKGECVISGIPYGYVDLTVETKDGAFVGDQVVNVAPSGTVVVSLSVAKYEDRERAGSDGKVPRETPGTRAPAQGSAELKLVPAGREFWKSPKGVAIIGGAVVAILILSSGHGGSGSTTSSSAQ